MKPKKLFSFILAAAMTISLLPTFTITAGATATEKNIMLGTSALSGYDRTTKKYKYVYYGTYESNPIKWRILTMNGNEGTYYESAPYTPTKVPTTPVDGTVYTDSDETTKFIYLAKSGKYYKQTTSTPMFLLSEYALKQMAYELAWDYDDGDGQTNTYAWRYSDAWYWCNDTSDNTSFISSSFTDSEKAYLLKTSRGSVNNDEIKGDTFFFASRYEVMSDYLRDYSQDDNICVAKLLNESGDAVGWWLRTPDTYGSDFRVYYVIKDGWTFSSCSVDGVDEGCTSCPAFRPAFNLNRSSVLFTSAANGEKKTANAGTLSANGTNATDEYKLTMLDSDREFAVIEKSVNSDKGETVTLDYENAETGSNEYISAMIVNDDDEVLYYGQLEYVTESGAESGTVAFKVPSDIDYGTYQLRVFNEQINGGMKTDFSSDFQTVTLKVSELPPKATCTDAPTAKTLTYNGAEQVLVTEGAANGGKVKYSLETRGTYSETAPSAKNAGTHRVWYYIEGDSAHSDSNKAYVDVKISPKDIGDATITLGNSLTYDGTSQTQTISSVTVDGLELTENIDYTVSNNTAKFPADNYELTVTGIGNFTGTATKGFTVARADSQTTATADSSVTYGDTLTLTATVAQSARLMNRVDFYVGEGDDAVLLGTAREISGTATLEVDTTQKKLKIGDNKITADYSGSIVLNGSKSNTITVTLNPKEVGLEWDGYSTRTYDGTASNVTASAIGIIGNDAVSVTVERGNKINANPIDTVYLATATGLTGAEAGYYKLPSNAVQIYKIEPKVAEIEWNLPTDFTYDGTEKEVTATVKNAVAGDAVGVVLSGNKGTAATSYTAKVESLDNANYTLEGCTNLTCDWTISPKKINAALTIAAPAKNATPQTSIETDEYTATVTWTPSVTDKFAANTEYTATITLAPKSDYTLDGIAAEEYTVDGATAVTKAADENIVTAVFPKTAGNSGGGGGSSASGTYTVTFETNGGNTITSQKVQKSGVATEPTTPAKEGYVFDGWYTDKNCTTAYDFDTKVTKNITLYAKWVEDEMQEPTDDKKDDEPQTDDWSNPFTDVKETDWFFDSVKYANENGLMSGMTSDTFAPNENITRGMFVTVLYRAEGEPSVDRFVPFADVRAYMYCANAINWARRNNIVSGMTETEFAPDESITREQIAAILYRYAKFKGYDMSVGEDTNILSYADFDEISEYAISAVQYAVGSGLMKGKTERTFHPKDNATRAEIATILSRFIENNK